MLVETDKRDGVATLLLNRPDKRNALDGAVMESLAAAIDGVRDDPAVRVVVVRGAGPIFSSGIDHALLLEVFQKSRSVPFSHLHGDLQDVFHRLERMRKPVIAALHGACVGMAFELALACDFRVATIDCLVGLPEIHFGIVPDVGGTTRLVRAVGPVKAKELVMLGSLIPASEAARLGLVTEVAADRDDLDTRVGALAAQLSALSPVALGHAKALVQQSAEIDARASYQLEGTVQEVLLHQPDVAERMPRALQWIRDRLRAGRA
ncbi:MAG TPA: enoyl-CoA hydratase/isomerase family protein [Kofleriaceae bacterium]|nr:enoyl-CoA hydratase/isomerase family protein [Kofleriaceae bacterium]